MSVDDALQYMPVFVLVFFRLAGMMIFAPLFGSSRIPKRIKVLITAVLALALTPGIARPVPLPDTTWALAVGIGGEMIFGLAMGMMMSFVFIAVQWAGEMIGQQMGLDLSSIFSPQFGHQGSIIGDMYYMFTLVIFLIIRGHHAMLQGVRASFDALPLLSVGMTPSLLDMLIGLLQSTTTLAIQLAAPILVTMLVVDVALGLLGKTMPQINVFSTGLSLRSAVGMVILIFGLVMTSEVIREALLDSTRMAGIAWRAPATQ